MHHRGLLSIKNWEVPVCSQMGRATTLPMTGKNLRAIALAMLAFGLAGSTVTAQQSVPDAPSTVQPPQQFPTAPSAKQTPPPDEQPAGSSSQPTAQPPDSAPGTDNPPPKMPEVKTV